MLAVSHDPVVMPDARIISHFSPMRQSLFYFKRCWKISIFHECMVWIEKSVTKVTDRHHEACRVMPDSNPE